MAMDCGQNVDIVSFLPYLLQDFWELGTPPEMVIDFVQKHCKNGSTLRALDVGCGKGAVSIKLAAALKCHCYGIDGIPEFIEASKAKSREYGVAELCHFDVGDVREIIKEMAQFDVIVLGAIGPVFGDYEATLSTLSQHLTKEGIIIVDDAYIDDSSAFQHPLVLSRKALLKQVERSGMALVDEITGKYGESFNLAQEMENIITRCNELKTKYPEKVFLFENYIQNQADEYDVLENKVVCSMMVFRKIGD